MIKRFVLLLVSLLMVVGCNYEDVPPTHKGRVFEKAAYGESRGFIGGILGPGSHNLGGFNNWLKLVQCTETTVREHYESPSKDGVVFGADVYVRFATNCDDPKAVEWILDNVQPGTFLKESEEIKAADKDGDGKADPTVEDETYSKNTVSAAQLFASYIRPTLVPAVRDALSAYSSNEINLNRQAVGTMIDTGLRKRLDDTFKSAKAPAVVQLAQVDLSNIVFPKSMVATMEQLANVKTEVELEKEKAKKVEQQGLTELQRVEREIITEQKNKELARVKAQKVGSEIEEIARASRANPEYEQYLLTQARADAIRGMPKALEFLGEPGMTLVLGDEQLQMLLKGGVK